MLKIIDKAKYTYYLLEPGEDDKNLLKEIKKELEKQSYTCKLSMK